MLKSSSTIRKAVKIPKLPDSVDDLVNLPKFKMLKSIMVNNELVFDKPEYLYEAIQTGFFLLRIPDKLNLDSTDKLVNNFFKDKLGEDLDQYRGYKKFNKIGDYQGYFDRPNDQWENFYIEARNWVEFLPSDVALTGSDMAELGIHVLRSVLKNLSVPEIEWEKITGGLTANMGHQMLAFNHFRFEKKARGTKLHRDSGWVTVLRSTEPGLIGFIDDTLFSIEPEPGYFIINFGSTFEVLTEKLDIPVKANVHGVVRTLPSSHRTIGRTSYVIFLDSDLDGHIYQYKKNKLIPVQTMKEFAIQEVSRTYDDDNYL